MVLAMRLKGTISTQMSTPEELHGTETLERLSGKALSIYALRCARRVFEICKTEFKSASLTNEFLIKLEQILDSDEFGRLRYPFEYDWTPLHSMAERAWKVARYVHIENQASFAAECMSVCERYGRHLLKSTWDSFDMEYVESCRADFQSLLAMQNPSVLALGDLWQNGVPDVAVAAVVRDTRQSQIKEKTLVALAEPSMRAWRALSSEGKREASKRFALLCSGVDCVTLAFQHFSDTESEPTIDFATDRIHYACWFVGSVCRIEPMLNALRDLASGFSSSTIEVVAEALRENKALFDLHRSIRNPIEHINDRANGSDKVSAFLLFRNQLVAHTNLDMEFDDLLRPLSPCKSVCVEKATVVRIQNVRDQIANAILSEADVAN